MTIHRARTTMNLKITQKKKTTKIRLLISLQFLSLRLTSKAQKCNTEKVNTTLMNASRKTSCKCENNKKTKENKSAKKKKTINAKLLKIKNKAEREERKKAKANKKAAKDAKVKEAKSVIEAQLEEALKNENMSKTFSEMTPKTILDFKNRKDKLPGVQVHKTRLNCEEKIKILVQEPEIIDEGFFYGKHLTFTIQTSPFGWKVKRKDKDFNVLRDYLVKAYPHILVPMCPEHHSTKSIDKNFLRKREHLLNKFMSKCMQQEELKGCPILVDFLSFEGNKILKPSHNENL